MTKKEDPKIPQTKNGLSLCRLQVKQVYIQNCCFKEGENQFTTATELFFDQTLYNDTYLAV